MDTFEFISLRDVENLLWGLGKLRQLQIDVEKCIKATWFLSQ